MLLILPITLLFGSFELAQFEVGGAQAAPALGRTDAGRAGKNFLDGADKFRPTVGGDQHWVTQPMGAPVLGESTNHLGVRAGARQKVQQQHLAAIAADTLGGHHPLARLTGMQALDDALNEQVDDLKLNQIPARERVILPCSWGAPYWAPAATGAGFAHLPSGLHPSLFPTTLYLHMVVRGQMVSATGAVGGLLRLTFSKAVTPEVLAILHSTGMAGSLPGALTSLLDQAGVERISGVHSLSPAEIADDRYGFAREFSVVLKTGVDTNRAAEILRRSPFVESVTPVLLRRSF